MATVIFDFDSTLITCESLEVILSKKKLSNEMMDQIREITNQGMSGTITFLSSLEQRMKVIPLYKQNFIDFGHEAVKYLTPGIKELVNKLNEQLVDVWIVSGAVREAMLPVAKQLNIPEKNVLGVELIFSLTGEYQEIDMLKPISRSKWQGAQSVVSQWSSPKIAVGDGMTDYALYEHHLVDRFITFTKNIRRLAVVAKGSPEACTIEELRQKIQEVINK